MKKLILTLAAILLAVTPALAQVNNGAGGQSTTLGSNTRTDTVTNGAAGVIGTTGAGSIVNTGAGANIGTAAGGTITNTNTNTNTNVNANSLSQHQSQGQGQEQAQRQKQGQAQGQKQSANNEGVNVETDVPRQAPPAIAPNLAVSSLTCYGSWGIGLSSPFGGISGGGPVKDDDCQRARNALIFVNMGYQQVALALLAQNPDNAKAMADAGVAYPGRKAEVAPAAAAPASAALAPSVAPAKANDAPSKCGKDMVVTPSGFCRWK